MTRFPALFRSKSSGRGMKFWYETVTTTQDNLTPRNSATLGI